MKRFMFVIVAMACMFTLGYGQNQIGVDYNALIAASLGQPLALAATNGLVGFENLRPGVCYQTVADPNLNGNANITPWNAFTAEVYVPETVVLTGEGAQNVAVTFILPSRLFPMDPAATGYVDMTYDIRSAGWFTNADATVHFFNPQNGLTVSLPIDDGTVNINLGGNPCVSQDATDINAAGFGNEALLTCAYTGF